MPWSVEQGGGTCGDSQWAVIKTDTGETEGCHDTKADAEQQVAALYAQEESSMSTPVNTWGTLRTARGVKRDLIRMTPSSTFKAVLGLRDGEPPADAATSDPGNGLGILAGYPIVFDQWTEIDSWWEGNFLERVRGDALDDTLKGRGSRAKVLFNHGMDFQIGDKPLGKPQRQEPMDYGMWAETPLSDTSYNHDLAALIRDGAIDGQSFRFNVIGEEWRSYAEGDKRPDYNPNGLDERTITRLELFEHGPVTFPAYEATTLGLRSVGELAAWRAGDERVRSELIRAVATIRGIDVSLSKDLFRRVLEQCEVSEATLTQGDRSLSSRAGETQQPPEPEKSDTSGLTPGSRSQQQARQARVEVLLARTGIAFREKPDEL